VGMAMICRLFFRAVAPTPPARLFSDVAPRVTLSDLVNNPGNNAFRKRVGRGVGSGMGKTSTSGHKGQKSRSGGGRGGRGFIGGQTPLQKLMPKRGFNNTKYALLPISCKTQRRRAVHRRCLTFEAQPHLLLFRPTPRFAMDLGKVNVKDLQLFMDMGRLAPSSDGASLNMRDLVRSGVTSRQAEPSPRSRHLFSETPPFCYR